MASDPTPDLRDPAVTERMLQCAGKLKRLRGAGAILERLGLLTKVRAPQEARAFGLLKALKEELPKVPPAAARMKLSEVERELDEMERWLSEATHPLAPASVAARLDGGQLSDDDCLELARVVAAARENEDQAKERALRLLELGLRSVPDPAPRLAEILAHDRGEPPLLPSEAALAGELQALASEIAASGPDSLPRLDLLPRLQAIRTQASARLWHPTLLGGIVRTRLRARRAAGAALASAAGRARRAGEELLSRGVRAVERPDPLPPLAVQSALDGLPSTPDAPMDLEGIFGELARTSVLVATFEAALAKLPSEEALRRDAETSAVVERRIAARIAVLVASVGPDASGARLVSMPRSKVLLASWELRALRAFQPRGSDDQERRIASAIGLVAEIQETLCDLRSLIHESPGEAAAQREALTHLASKAASLAASLDAAPDRDGASTARRLHCARGLAEQLAPTLGTGAP